jgi:hypothetical protein
MGQSCYQSLWVTARHACAPCLLQRGHWRRPSCSSTRLMHLRQPGQGWQLAAAARPLRPQLECSGLFCWRWMLHVLRKTSASSLPPHGAPRSSNLVAFYRAEEWWALLYAASASARPAFTEPSVQWDPRRESSADFAQPLIRASVAVTIPAASTLHILPR